MTTDIQSLLAVFYRRLWRDGIWFQVYYDIFTNRNTIFRYMSRKADFPGEIAVNIFTTGYFSGNSFKFGLTYAQQNTILQL